MLNRFLPIVCLFLMFFTSQCSITRSASTTPKGVSSNHSKRQQIVNYATKQKGTPYKYAGRSPKGFDCSGFTYYVYNAFDIELTPVSKVQETQGRKVSLKDVQPGDLVFFRKSKAGKVFHVALVVKNDSEGIRVIHSTSSRGVVIDNISTSSYWRPKISTARSFL